MSDVSMDELREEAAMAGLHDVGQFSRDELEEALRRRKAGQDPNQAATHAKRPDKS